MKNAIIKILFLFSAFAILRAAEVRTAKEMIETGNFSEDYFFLGKSLVHSGRVKDLFFLGNSLSFSGETGGGILAIGENLDISGSVKDNFIAFGRKITIKGNVQGSLLLAAETIILEENSYIEGTLFLAARTIKMNGKVEGELYAGSRILIINGIVNGNAKVGSQRFDIGENGKINGNLQCRLKYPIPNDDTSKILGNVEMLKHGMTHYGFQSGFFTFRLIYKIFYLLFFLLFGLLLLLLPFMVRATTASVKSFWITAFYGLIPFFLYPIFSFLFLIGIVTIPITLFLWIAAFPLFLFVSVVGVTVFGEMLFRVFNWNNKNRFLCFLFGFLFYIVLGRIPFVNFFALCLFPAAGCGVVLSWLRGRSFI